MGTQMKSMYLKSGQWRLFILIWVLVAGFVTVGQVYAAGQDRPGPAVSEPAQAGTGAAKHDAPAFLVATVTVVDAEKFRVYASRAGKTFVPYGGESVLRGRVDSALAGEVDHQMVGIVRFPSLEALKAWYNSPHYQELIPLRDEAARVSITIYLSPA